MKTCVAREKTLREPIPAFAGCFCRPARYNFLRSPRPDLVGSGCPWKKFGVAATLARSWLRFSGNFLEEESEIEIAPQVVLFPDPVLRTPAEPIMEIDSTVRQIAERMIEMMYEAKGVGLAGQQVGLTKRIVALDISEKHNNGFVYINPVITEQTGSCTAEEGCLSLPGITAKVTRAEAVRIKAYDLKGNELTVYARDLEARAWQHELDHLDGRLIIDYMSPLARIKAAPRLRELKREYEQAHAKKCRVSLSS